MDESLKDKFHPEIKSARNYVLKSLSKEFFILEVWSSGISRMNDKWDKRILIRSAQKVGAIFDAMR